MNKLIAFLALCITFILITCSLKLEPEKLFFEITGFLDGKYEGVTVTLQE